MRYKVFYGNDKNDYAVVYASTTAGAEDMFRLYNPDKTSIINLRNAAVFTL